MAPSMKLPALFGAEGWCRSGYGGSSANAELSKLRLLFAQGPGFLSYNSAKGVNWKQIPLFGAAQDFSLWCWLAPITAYLSIFSPI